MAAPTTISFDSLKRQLADARYAPVYILHGEEGYYIDELVKIFEQILPEEDREFALTNVYAPQVDDPKSIVDLCRTLPMLAERQVIIVREAQNVKGDFIDKLAPYAANPTKSTILVVASRGEKLKGKDFIKAVKANGVLYESSKVWPSEVPALAAKYIKDKGLNVDEKSVALLADYVGTSLSRLYNEIDKLVGILGKGALITPEAIEMYVGISKDYNNFELLDALAARDAEKAMRIVRYFVNNPKPNPYVLTSAAMFNFFADLMQAWYTPDRSERGLAEALGFNMYNKSFQTRYRNGLRSYNPFQVIEILDVLRKYDVQSKGVGSRMDPYEALTDLVFRILTAQGQLPV